MSIFEALVLAIIQGVTEFLPISSTAHLILVPWWLGWEDQPLVYDVTVHIGTTLAVIIYFWRDWINLIKAGLATLQKRAITTTEERVFWFIIVSCIPAGIGGLLFQDYLDSTLSEPWIVAVTLLVTAALLVVSELLTAKQTGEGLEKMTLMDSIWIGLAQAFALIPAISRSGSTISAGLVLGFNRDTATRFSFLMSTPIILGAGLVKALDVATGGEPIGDNGPALVVGFIVSALTGYASIAFLISFVKRRSLYGFAAYCVAFSLISLVAIAIRG